MSGMATREYTTKVSMIDGVESCSVEADRTYLSTRSDFSKDQICRGSFESIGSALQFACEQVLQDEFPPPDAADVPFEDNAEVILDGHLPLGHVVYFMQAQTGGPIKIGWSADVRRRMESFQPGCPIPLKIILCVRGSIYDEQIIHKKFSRFRLHGEWFEPAAELLQFLDVLRSHKRITRSIVESGCTKVVPFAQSDSAA